MKVSLKISEIICGNLPEFNARVRSISREEFSAT